jgi:hypothetical protein
MSSEAEFPKSPLRDFDPFGKKSGANPFAEANAAPAQENSNIYAASNALAESAPMVEYEAILQPRIMVIALTFAMGLSMAVISTLVLIFFADPATELTFNSILYWIALAFFAGGVFTTRLDLRAMRRGAMKSDQIGLVRRASWVCWLGLAFSAVMAVFCIWRTIEDLFHRAFG